MKLALDTNLLLVLVVGLTDRDLVGKHRRTRTFTPEAYDFLLRMVSGAEEIIVTPHVLAETSNLLGQDDDPRCQLLRKKLSDLIQIYPERYVAASALSQSGHFLRLGIADCGILTVMAENVFLLTDDLPLYLTAAASFPDRSWNFTHIRQANDLF